MTVSSHLWQDLGVCGQLCCPMTEYAMKCIRFLIWRLQMLVAHVTAIPFYILSVIIFKFHNLVRTITLQFHNHVEPKIMYYTILFR